MEFWGVEVPAGKPTVCQPGDNFYLHVSQAALGESKDKSGKGNERVVLKVQVEENEVVLGTLSQGKCDQMSLDLVFDRDFKITHNSNTSSVFICGYRTEGPDEFVGFNTYYDSEEDEDEDEDEEEGNEAPIPAAVPIKANGDASVKLSKSPKSEKSGKPVSSLTEKAASAAAKAITEGLQTVMQNKAEEEDDDDGDDESDDEEEGMEGTVRAFVDDIAEESLDEFDDGSDEEIDNEDDEEDDEDEMNDDFDSDSSDEEELKIGTPKSGKKRAAVGKETGSEKKSKLDASSKSGGHLGQAPVSAKKEKKSGPVTPAAKTSGNAKEAKTPTDKGLQKPKTPKGTPATPTTPSSDKKLGQYKCTGCDRNFITESALSQHSAAKHKK